MSWDIKIDLTVDNKYGLSLGKCAWVIIKHFLEACEHVSFNSGELNFERHVFFSNPKTGVALDTFPASDSSWSELESEFLQRQANSSDAIIMVEFAAKRYLCEENELLEVEDDVHLWVKYNKGKNEVEAKYFPGGRQFFGGLNEADEFNYEMLQSEVKALTFTASKLVGKGPNGVNCLFYSSFGEKAKVDCLAKESEENIGERFNLSNGILLVSNDFPKGDLPKSVGDVS